MVYNIAGLARIYLGLSTTITEKSYNIIFCSADKAACYMRNEAPLDQ